MLVRNIMGPLSKLRKVVYNNCYGSFSLSTEAIKLGRQLSNNPKWGGATLEGEKYDDNTICPPSLSNTHYKDIDRHDPILVQVVEQLGPKAGGKYALLKIAIVKYKYRIDYYDGNETVYAPEYVEWID